MRNMETALGTPREAQVTTAEERLVAPCPSCGKDVERVIPAGTTLPIARVMRRLLATCTTCAEREDGEAEDRKRRQERESRIDRCELPPMLRGLTFDTYDVTRPGALAAATAAQEWARGEHPKRGLLLVGPVGVGKTRLAATATWAALDRISVRYVNVAELIVRMSAGFGDRDRQESLRVLTGRGPIVLDDLDKVNPSMHVLSHLYTAIEGRVQSNASMIVTTNLDPAQLVAKFRRGRAGEDPDERRVAAEAIVSRLLGHCTALEITGPDGRQR